MTEKRKFNKKKQVLMIEVKKENDEYCETIELFRCFFGNYCPLWLACHPQMLIKLKKLKKEYRAKKVLLLFKQNHETYTLVWEETPHLPKLKKLKKIKKNEGGKTGKEKKDE